MSPDLKNATALVIRSAAATPEVMAGLERSRKWFRGQWRVAEPEACAA